MKIVDDKLRIIDDVPSSAVELSVKEKVSKFLKRPCVGWLAGLWNKQSEPIFLFPIIFYTFIFIYLSVPKESSTPRTDRGGD